LGLRRRQEPGAQSRRRDHCLPDAHRGPSSERYGVYRASGVPPKPGRTLGDLLVPAPRDPPAGVGRDPVPDGIFAEANPQVFRLNGRWPLL
jgi:hypothetical protein